jgi:hypothetical protein
MTRKSLLLPEDITAALRRRYDNQRSAWLLGQGTWPLTFSLGVPQEREALEGAEGVRRWVAAWSAWAGAGQVQWAERVWPRLGRQRLPSVLSFGNAEEVAAALGHGRWWGRTRARMAELCGRWPGLAGHAVLPRHADAWAQYDDVEFSRLFALFDWVDRHPHCRLYLRQLPVEGVDTKWIQRRKGLIVDLALALNPGQTGRDLHELLGLTKPRARVRLRVLCAATRAKLGGLGDIETTWEDLASATWTPRRILIVENLETGIALPDWPHTLVLMGLGLAVSRLEELPWLKEAECFYWGDLDSHGFVILDRVRRIIPGIRSVLMDEATLLAHRTLWVAEEVPATPVRLPALTDAEHRVYDGLRGNEWGQSVRMEQERLAWPEAVRSLEQAFGQAHMAGPGTAAPAMEGVGAA